MVEIQTGKRNDLPTLFVTNKSAKGRVLNLVGQPLADITILIDDVTTTKTDARGVYILDIERLKGKSMIVAASHAHYVFNFAEPHAMEPRQASTMGRGGGSHEVRYFPLQEGIEGGKVVSA